MSKKTKLVVGGCSYTFGANKEIDGTITWAEQLADRLDMELVNTSRNGTGNEFILTKLTEAIYTHDNIGLVIAMWSEFERIDIPVSPMAKRFVKLDLHDGAHYRQKKESTYNEKNAHWSTVHAGVINKSTPENRSIIIEQGMHPSKVDEWLNQQNQMVNIWNEWQSGRGQVYSKIKCLEKSLLQMLLFKQLVKSKGLDYMQCVGVNPYSRGEEEGSHTALKGQQYSKAILDSVYFDELDEPNFIGFPIMKEIGGYWFDSLLPTVKKRGELWDYDYRVSLEDSHPNTKGHKIFSDLLYNEYQKIYKSDLTPASE
jgi:hypothetical protein